MDGVTNVDDLRRALRAQFEFVLEDIIDHFRVGISDASERSAAIRIKERDAMRTKRLNTHLTSDGGAKPEQKTVSND